MTLKFYSVLNKRSQNILSGRTGQEVLTEPRSTGKSKGIFNTVLEVKRYFFEQF